MTVTTPYTRERYNARSMPDLPANAPQWARDQAIWLQKEHRAIQRAIPWPRDVDIRDFSVPIGSGSDCGPSVQAMTNALADNTRILVPPGGKLYFRTTVLLSCRNNLQFVAEHGLNTDGNDTCAQFIWDGDLFGRIFSLDRCQHIRFYGIQFRTLDQGAYGGCALSMTSASAAIADASTFGQFAATDVGRRIVVRGAGPSGDPLVAKILSVTDSRHATLDTNASTTVSLAEWCVGSHYGLPGKTAIDSDGETGDGHLAGFNCAITNGSQRATFVDGDFFPDMVGQSITITGAGVAAADLVTTIASVITDKIITVTNAASTTVVAATWTVASRNAGASSFGSHNIAERCQFHTPVRYAMSELEFDRIACVSQSNHEFYERTECFYTGGDFARNLNLSLSTTSGSNAVTSASNQLSTTYVGLRVRITGAGNAGGTQALDATITSVTDTAHATISVNASSTQTNVRCILSESYGVGIHIGRLNSNSLGHRFWYVGATNLATGIQGGNHFSHWSNPTFCETGTLIDGQSRATMMIGEMGEGSGCLVKVTSSGSPIYRAVCHIDVNGITPNSGAFDFVGMDVPFLMDGEIIGDPPLASTTVVTNFTAGQLCVRGLTSSAPMTLAQFGVDPTQDGPTFEWSDVSGTISDLPAFTGMYGNNTLSSFEVHSSGGSDDRHALRGRFTMTGGYNSSGTRGPSAITGVIEATSGALPDTTAYAAVEASIGLDTTAFNQISNIAGVRVVSPQKSGFHSDANPVMGMLVESPGSSISTIHDLYGARVRDLTTPAGGSVWRGHGVYVEGPSDDSWFAGGVVVGSPSSTSGGTTPPLPTNAKITNVQVYTPTLTPASVAANTIAEQTFTVTGLTAADKVIVNPPAIANSTGIVGARVSATDTLAIRFANTTSGALTPSSGTYTVIAIRS